MRYRTNGGDSQAAVLPLLCFHARPWWDVVAPGDTDPTLRSQCKELVAQSGESSSTAARNAVTCAHLMHRGSDRPSVCGHVESSRDD